MSLELHLTGPLQSNKVKLAASLFDVFHTLDREKIAKELFKYSDLLKKKKIFIQVNTGDEDTKSGIKLNEIRDFSNFCIEELKLNIVGLMCIPPINEEPSMHFLLLQNIANRNNLPELSMGMSNDYEDAIKFGATSVRIGSLLFGERKA